MKVTRTYCDECKTEIHGDAWRLPQYIYNKNNERWLINDQCDELCESCAKRRAKATMEEIMSVGTDALLQNVMEEWLCKYHNQCVSRILPDYYRGKKA